MSKLAGIAGSNTGLMAGAVVFAAAAIGAGIYFGGQQDRLTTEVAQPVVVVPEQVAQEEPKPAEVVAEVTADDPAPPTIEEVRVEPDGLTIVAGRAAAGSKIVVLLDGEESTVVDVDGTGSFAAFTMLAPSEDARVLSLVQRLENEELASVDDVILAPLAAPVEDTQLAETPLSEEQQQVSALEAQTADEEGVNVATQSSELSKPVEVAALEAPEASETPITVEGAPTPEQVAKGDDVTPEQVVPGDDVAPEYQTEMTRPLGATETAALDAGSIASGDTPTAGLSETQLAALDADAPNAPSVDTALPPARETPLSEEAPEVSDAPLTQASGDTTPSATPEVAQTAKASASRPAPAAPEGDKTEQVAVLRSTAQGIELLSPPPQVQDNVALDTISYSTEGEVQLAGRANPEAEEVRVYLNNRPVATLEIDPDGRWRGDVPEVDTGIYTLRVDQIAASGSVTSRIVTPFKREDPDVLQAATRDGESPAKRITVQAGDTLWAISRDRYGEPLLYVQVFEANRDAIKDPDLIFPGQVFDLPEQ